MLSSSAFLASLLTALAVRNIAAVPKPFSCISYMEDENFLQDDYDSGSDEVVMSYTNGNVQKPNTESSENFTEDVTFFDASRPQVRICQTDYTFCFTLWRQNPNGIKIEKQGCWKESTEQNATCSQHECTSSAPTSRNNTLYYCCCSGDACNEHVSVVEPAPLQLSKEATYTAGGNRDGDFLQQRELMLSNFLAFCALALIGVLIIALTVFIYRHKIFQKPAPEEAPLAPSGPGYSSNLRNVDNINLICMLGCGKFGTVMKGLLHDQEVAVKIYPEAHQQYYINERNIYTLPFMDCPALLKYLGYDERQTIDGEFEYQLVLSLAPLGCLQDYIIANTLDFETFCNMAKSITRGISHLHTEIRSSDEFKPCIAHRDLNSRNVLVKADRSCCISDFGFALKVFGARYEYKGEVSIAETKSINEVGTLRYMAPELLEGAVNLRDCETSLKQMDVYALSLVVWEVATRCADFYPSVHLIQPYKAPYEAEVGPHPNFDLMQAYVVRRKARPLFPSCWNGSAAAKLVKDTCEDCWDHDAEARLTSLCAEERMHEVASLRPRSQLVHASGSFLNTNDLTGVCIIPNDNVKNQCIGDEVFSSTSTLSFAVVQPPPNRQISTQECELQKEKNHLISSQQQLQPYNGRNPCQARNLAPLTIRSPQRLVEKSKKHSFQSKDEHSLSCIEDDVSVEELIVGVRNGNDQISAEKTTNMGQGFPKQQNTDRTLRGWHGVRALIQKKLFRADAHRDGAVLRTLNLPNGNANIESSGDRSNLVNSHYATKGKTATHQNPCEKNIRSADSFNLSTMPHATIIDACTQNLSTHNRRPNNLDLSPMTDVNDSKMVQPTIMNPLNTLSQQSIHTIVEEQSEEQERTINENGSRPCKSKIIIHDHNLNTRNNNIHSYGNSFSTCNENSNENVEQEKHISEANIIRREFRTHPQQHVQHFKRQRSLEVFREVFSGRGSTDRLRDPSQRVKTPGDVPPSVRKVRASKTLSLYDDRMMDSSTLNIL